MIFPQITPSVYVHVNPAESLMLLFMVLTFSTTLKREENKCFTRKPAMACEFSFASRRIKTQQMVGSISQWLVHKSNFAATAKYWPASGNWLQFICSSSETEAQSLTNVVYFDVWPDCVVGRRLTGVIICLGDWETHHIYTMRKREREKW